MYEGQICGTESNMKNTLGGMKVMHNPTLSENIEQRINMLEEQVARLKNVKEKLKSGSMLDVPIDDLRFAMNY